LDALIQNSPPLSRKEHSAASRSKDENNNEVVLRNSRDVFQDGSISSDDEIEVEENNNKVDMPIVEKKKTRQPSYTRRVRPLQRTNSKDIKFGGHHRHLERKSSVVQISAKDDTSDYNTDEEVFQSRSDGDLSESISYNTTICHVKTGQIKDTTQIHVSSSSSSCKNTHSNNNSNSYNGFTHNNKSLTKDDLNLLSDPATYDTKERNASSAPASTKISTALPLDVLPIQEKSRSQMMTEDHAGNSEELTSKSVSQTHPLSPFSLPDSTTTECYVQNQFWYNYFRDNYFPIIFGNNLPNCQKNITYLFIKLTKVEIDKEIK